MSMGAAELSGLPIGAQVEDADGDIWTKNSDTLWDLADSEDSFYLGRASDSISESYGPFRGLGTVRTQTHSLEAEPEPEVAGVWIVWTSSSKSGDINGVWPDEIGALRFVNENGYGHAAFQPFGQVTY